MDKYKIIIINIFKKLKDRSKKNRLSSSLFTVVGFILVLYLSWFYFSPSHLSEEERIHGFLQDRFQTLISDVVANKHPEIDEIIFHKVWTKNISDSGQIKIFFSYSLITQGSAGGSVLIEGEATLEKSLKKKELWIVKDFQITDSLIDFSEPLVIKAVSLSEDQ